MIGRRFVLAILISVCTVQMATAEDKNGGGTTKTPPPPPPPKTTPTPPPTGGGVFEVQDSNFGIEQIDVKSSQPGNAKSPAPTETK